RCALHSAPCWRSTAVPGRCRRWHASRSPYPCPGLSLKARCARPGTASIPAPRPQGFLAAETRCRLEPRTLRRPQTVPSDLRKSPSMTRTPLLLALLASTAAAWAQPAPVELQDLYINAEAPARSAFSLDTPQAAGSRLDLSPRENP